MSNTSVILMFAARFFLIWTLHRYIGMDWTAAALVCLVLIYSIDRS